MKKYYLLYAIAFLILSFTFLGTQNTWAYKNANSVTSRKVMGQVELYIEQNVSKEFSVIKRGPVLQPEPGDIPNESVAWVTQVSVKTPYGVKTGIFFVGVKGGIPQVIGVNWE